MLVSVTAGELFLNVPYFWYLWDKCIIQCNMAILDDILKIQESLGDLAEEINGPQATTPPTTTTTTSATTTTPGAPLTTGTDPLKESGNAVVNAKTDAEIEAEVRAADPSAPTMAEFNAKKAALQGVGLSTEADEALHNINSRITNELIPQQNTDLATPDIEEEDDEKSKFDWQGFGENIKAAAPAAINAANAVNDATGRALNMMGKIPTDSAFTAQQTVGDMLMGTGNLYGMAAGLAVKGVSTAATAAGINTSFVNKDKMDFVKGRPTSVLERLGANAKALVGLGSTAGTALKTQALEKGRAAYEDTAHAIDTNVAMEGKRYGVNPADLHKAQETANSQMMLMDNIVNTNEVALNNVQSSYNDYNQLYNNRMHGSDSLFLKEGGSLQNPEASGDVLYTMFVAADAIVVGSYNDDVKNDAAAVEDKVGEVVDQEKIDRAKQIIESTKGFDAFVSLLKDTIMRTWESLNDIFGENQNVVDSFEDFADGDFSNDVETQSAALPILNALANYFDVQPAIQAFQEGGVIGKDINLLPEGALHKNRNHLEDVNPEIGSKVTEKGIPVIVTDENCNIKQVAEVEKEEIILRSELTKRIEEL